MEKYINNYQSLKRDMLINLIDDYEQLVQHHNNQIIREAKSLPAWLKIRKLVKPIPTINGYLNSDATITEEERKNAEMTDIDEVVVRIIDEFEEVLSKHNIFIPDEDRLDGKFEACIYGQTYFNLEETIKNIIKENL